jgi:hypothetical protein
VKAFKEIVIEEPLFYRLELFIKFIVIESVCKIKEEEEKIEFIKK